MIDPKRPISDQYLPKPLYAVLGACATLLIAVGLLITQDTSSESASGNTAAGRFSYMDSVSRGDDVTFYMKGMEHQGIQYNAGKQNSPLGILIGTLTENERIKITFTQLSRDSRIRHVIDVKILE